MAQTGKLGNADSQLGSVLLAYAGAGESPPSNETKTGKLGTSDAMLGGLLLGVGEEGEASGGINVSASNTLALSQSAECQAVFERSASSTLLLDHLASLTKSLNINADSVLTLSDESTVTTDAWIHELTAENTLSLTDDASVTSGTWLHEVTAENTLAMTQEATGALGDVYNLTADNTIILSQETIATEDEWILDLSADSAMSLSQEASVTTGQWVHDLSVDSTLALSQDAIGGLILEVTAESTLALTHGTDAGFIYEAAADTTLSLSQEADGYSTHIYDLEAESELELDHACGTVNVLNLTVDSQLSLSHDLHVARPWYVSASNVLQETHQELDPETLEIIEVTTGLSTSASANAIWNLAADSILSIGQDVNYAYIAPGGIIVSAENTLELMQDAWRTELGLASNALSLAHSVTGDAGPLLGSQLDLEQSAGVTVVRNRSLESELELGQAVTYILVKQGAVELCDYAPAIGGGPIPASLQGPYPGVTSPFALIFPATGEPTDNVELRPPNLGNKDRLSFDRINRETRGGTLTVFADPDWPKVQTLVLSFSALYQDEAQDLLRFIRDHLGLEIRLSDWEQRIWKGVITTPDEPIIQDGKDSFSASFEFEGELLPV